MTTKDSASPQAESAIEVASFQFDAGAGILTRTRLIPSQVSLT